MINVHLGFLEEFSMDRIGPAGVYFFMALHLSRKFHTMPKHLLRQAMTAQVCFPCGLPNGCHAEEENMVNVHSVISLFVGSHRCPVFVSCAQEHKC